DAVAVEPRCDRPRAAAEGELLEDAPDHRRLRRDDTPPAAQQFAFGVELVHHLIAIAEAACYQPFGRTAALPTPDFCPQIARKQRVHRALKSDVQFADLAL